MSELTSAARRALRARVHHLKPVVMIGNGGLTPEVIREIDANLRSHELIKIRVLGDEREARDALMTAICEATNAQPVQQLGKILAVYRPKPVLSVGEAGVEESPEKRKPVKRARRKPRRRTKQSYQND